jgi:hypothetical protein
MIECEKYSMIDELECPKHWDRESEVCIPCNRETYEAYRYCIDMTTIIFNKNKLRDNVIENLNELIEFNLLSTNQKLSDRILYKYYERIEVNNLICNQTIPLDILVNILEKYYDNFDTTAWYYICKNQPVNIELIRKYYNKINWHALSLNKKILTFDIISTYSQNLIWQDLTTLGLCEEVILSYIDKMCPICWSNISMTSSLSNEFIRKHLIVLNKMGIFTCQQIEERLIEEIIEWSDIDDQEFLWNKVATCQKLTKDFIRKHITKLPLHLLIRNPRIKRVALKEVFG